MSSSPSLDLRFLFSHHWAWTDPRLPSFSSDAPKQISAVSALLMGMLWSTTVGYQHGLWLKTGLSGIGIAALWWAQHRVLNKQGLLKP